MDMEILQYMPGYMWALFAILMGLSIFLTILWIIVPFSIFGVKGVLQDMLHRLDQLEAHAEKLAAQKIDKGATKVDNTAGGKEEQSPQA